MSSCSDDEFWDKLLRQCGKCTNCGHNPHSMCKSYCEIWSCNEAAGFYWDKLLRKCIKCSDICGQHLQQCAEICYDGLLQVSVEGDDQNQSLSSEPSSEPSETCSNCFSDQRIPDKERKMLSNTVTPHQCIQIPSVADTRALPSAIIYKEKPFQIICSPSQPSIRETESFQEKQHIK
nr:TNFRSF13B isoform 2 [Scyliorhinus canicula]